MVVFGCHAQWGHWAPNGSAPLNRPFHDPTSLTQCYKYIQLKDKDWLNNYLHMRNGNCFVVSFPFPLLACYDWSIGLR